MLSFYLIIPIIAVTKEVMTKNAISSSARKQIQPYFMMTIVLWSIVMLVSYFVQTFELKQSISNEMLNTARSILQQDIDLRRWATEHGGVYVPITKDSPANPYLKDIPERDITTPSGRKLTLINPAYLLRQIYEFREKEGVHRGHITSLKPLRPQNKADKWEEEALTKFENGKNEFYEVTDVNGKKEFRFMRPLKNEIGCLKCHAKQDYKVGDNHGGISISFPTAPWFNSLNSSYFIFGIAHFLVWFFGVFGVYVAKNRIAYRISLFEEQHEHLLKAKEKAEESDKAKSLFLANMSHEIRTPMNAIVGYADLLQEGELAPSEQKEALNIINRSGNHLVQIINDLLDLSKFETQNVLIIKQPFDLRKLVQETFDTLIVDVDQKKVCPILRIDDGIAKHYIGDSIRVRQIIVNLLNNAIKFTNEGTIALKIQLGEFRESLHEIHFLFEDSGVGMGPEYQENIFRPFSQEDSTLSRKYSGAGLGLAIVKRLMDAMGGSITLRSIQGAGTVFDLTLTLPALSEEEELHLVEQEIPHHEGKYPHWVGKKILVVEDTATSALILLSWLRKTNCELVFAENGQEALLILEKQKFDLVLMDIQMPIVDGMTAAKKLRAQGKTLPLIALSAHAFAEYKKNAFDAGFNGYIVKPFCWKDVRAELDRFLSVQNST